MNHNQSLMTHTNRRETLLDQAAEKYFKLYLADWASRQQLSRQARHELTEILKDSFFFMETFVEESEEELDIEEYHDAVERYAG